MLGVDACVCVCVRLHSCSCEVKFVQEHGVARLWGGGRLRGSISYFLATTSRSSQMKAEAASDVDPKYWPNPRTVVSVEVRVGDMWVGVVWACILTFVWL